MTAHEADGIAVFGAFAGLWARQYGDDSTIQPHAVVGVRSCGWKSYQAVLSSGSDYPAGAPRKHYL
jgi:hypothetical protein